MALSGPWTRARLLHHSFSLPKAVGEVHHPVHRDTPLLRAAFAAMQQRGRLQEIPSHRALRHDASDMSGTTGQTTVKCALIRRLITKRQSPSPLFGHPAPRSRTEGIHRPTTCSKKIWRTSQCRRRRISGQRVEEPVSVGHASSLTVGSPVSSAEA